MHDRFGPTWLLVALAIAACGTKQPTGTGTCARAGVDVPGSTPMRDGGDAGRVDPRAARAIGDGVATDVLRTLESNRRAQRPDLTLSLLDFDVQSHDPSAGEGCLTYGFSYAYRQPTGRELGPGESHFDVFVTEEGMAWVVWGK